VAADIAGMLHFQKLDVYQRAIEFLTVANRIRRRLPKGNADLANQLRRASESMHLDVMKLDELLESELYERGVDLLERIVAMLTKLIDP
jgi:hypothetical protein